MRGSYAGSPGSDLASMRILLLQPQPRTEWAPIPGQSCGTMTFLNDGSPQLSCRLHRQWLPIVTPLRTFFLSREEVRTVVASLSLITGSSACPLEVESARDLPQLLPFWLVCGHWSLDLYQPLCGTRSHKLEQNWQRNR